MTKTNVEVDLDYNDNKLFNKGEENIANSVIISATPLIASVNNYNPTNLQTASILKVSSSLSVSITGLTAPDTTRNKSLWIFNSGSFNITLSNLSASSSTANQFNIGADLVLAQNAGAFFVYDTATSKWLCFGRNTSSQSSVTIVGQLIMSGDISATINANTNNFNPTGLSSANRLLLNCAGAFSLTGIAAQSIGTTIVIINTSNTNTLTIANNNVGSTGANRFLMNADVLLAPNQSCMIQYDLTNTRWRVISHL